MQVKVFSRMSPFRRLLKWLYFSSSIWLPTERWRWLLQPRQDAHNVQVPGKVTTLLINSNIICIRDPPPHAQARQSQGELAARARRQSWTSTMSWGGGWPRGRKPPSPEPVTWRNWFGALSWRPWLRGGQTNARWEMILFCLYTHRHISSLATTRLEGSWTGHLGVKMLTWVPPPSRRT